MLTFVRRNQVLLSSVSCLLFSLYIIAAAARGHLKSDPVGPLLIESVRPLQAGARTVVAILRELPRKLAIFRGLATENERLKSRIEELETGRNHLFELEATNRRLRGLLEFRARLPSPSITAAVIGNSASTWFHSFVLDRGSVEGVLKGMAVVTPAGVVGQVVSVTPRSAKVLLLTDPHGGVDVVVQRSRARGIVSGSVENGPIMKYVKRSDDIQEGDRLVTSGLDGAFPKGLLVGTITRVNKKSFGLFQTVAVALAVDPSAVEEVLVVSPEGADAKK